MKSVMTGKSSLSENYDTNTLVVLAWKTGNRSLLFHWQWVSAFQLPFAQKMFPRGISYLPKSDSWRQCLSATHTLQQKDYLTNDYLNSLLAAKYVSQFFRFFVLAWSYVKWSVILMVPQTIYRQLPLAQKMFLRGIFDLQKKWLLATIFRRSLLGNWGQFHFQCKRADALKC